MEQIDAFTEAMRIYELPQDAHLTKTCKVCGCTLQLLRVGKYTGFYLHNGKDDIAHCASLNPINPGHPIIAQSRFFYQVSFQNQDRFKALREEIAKKEEKQNGNSPNPKNI